MTRRRWLVAAALVAAAGAVAVAGALLLLLSLYSVAIDLLEIVSLPHG